MRIVNVEPLIQRTQNDIEYEEQLLKELDNPAAKIACQRQIYRERIWLGRLKSLPSVDRDVLNSPAKWVEAPDEGADGSWDACSHCGNESRWARSMFRYCPRCGSRMSGVE